MKTFEQIREELKHSVTESVNRIANAHDAAAHAHDQAAMTKRMDLATKKHHETAAMHHGQAADHLRAGNHDKAHASMTQAEIHSRKAARSSDKKISSEVHSDTRSVKAQHNSFHKAKAPQASTPPKKPSIGQRVKSFFKKEDTEKLDEISPELMTRYAKKAIPQQFKKHQDARMRGHDYMTKTGGDAKAKKAQAQADRRKKGIDSVRKRMDPKDRGQYISGRASRPQGGLRPGKGSSYQVDPSKVGGFRSKYLDQ